MVVKEETNLFNLHEIRAPPLFGLVMWNVERRGWLLASVLDG